MHHGRVIMAEAVQLHQDIMHGVEVEVRGGEVAFQVVRRMLHRREIIDLVFQGHNHHAARVLAGGPLDARARQGQAFLLGIACWPKGLRGELVF